MEVGVDPDAVLETMVELANILAAVRDSRDFATRERYDLLAMRRELMQHALKIKLWVDRGGFRPRGDLGTIRLLSEYVAWLPGYVEVPA